MNTAYLAPLATIEVDPQQPRQYVDLDRQLELAESIREHGILQPLIVREDNLGQLLLVAGERRLRAAQYLELDTVPVVNLGPISPAEARVIALVENLQREDLDIEDEARYLLALRDSGLSLHEVARRIKKSFNYVNRRVKLITQYGALAAYRAGELRNLNRLLDAEPYNADSSENPESALAQQTFMADLPLALQDAPPSPQQQINAALEQIDATREEVRFYRQHSVLKPLHNIILYAERVHPERMIAEDLNAYGRALDAALERLQLLRVKLNEIKPND